MTRKPGAEQEAARKAGATAVAGSPGSGDAGPVERQTGFILQPTYRVRDGRAVVMLLGRLESGPAFVVEEDRFRPYFFVPRDAAGRLAGVADVEVEETDVVDLEGGKLVRVVARVPAAVSSLREKLRRDGVAALEADVRFPYRYLIDRELRGGVAIERPCDRSDPRLVRFRNPELRPARSRPELRTLSIDLETSPDASTIFSIALAGAGAEEVHLVSQRPVRGAFTYPDEVRLLAAAGERIRELDPDILTGWNVVDFDLRTWVRRGERLRIPCWLGRIDGPISFQQDATFTRQTRADVPGRQVLDAVSLVRDAMRLDDYRLETAARAVLGRGKLLDSDAPDSAQEITRLFREDPETLAAYNLEDARLVLEILEREELLDLTIERSLLSGMQLDRVGASIASFDLLYLPELRRRGVAAPSVDPDRKSEGVTGGALLDPQPGIFRNVAVYDFKALYPSLIRTFNLDPLAHARAGRDAIAAPNGARFSRTEAILPEIIERFMERREDARRRGAVHADQAIKIMTNALFGVLGAASCRFFDPEIANAITRFGQQTLHWTRDELEAPGVRVLYGDTDSVFVELETREEGTAARPEAERLRGRVEERIALRVRREYGVAPRLRLELQRVFERFLLPRVRGGAAGSKKRYAGVAGGRLEIVGLESARRDWPPIARRLQTGLLERVFEDRDPLPFVRELVERVLAGDLDRELVYTKRVRKGALERYTATTPPHIRAARKAGRAALPVVHYVITHGGPEPVLAGRPLPEGIDARHYVERVMRPVAQAVLQLLGHDFDEALGEPRQLGLF